MAAASVLFVVLFVLWEEWRAAREEPKGPYGRVTRALLLWLAGALALSSLIVAYFAYRGVLYEFYYWSFGHGLVYVGGGSLSWKISTFVQGLGRVLAGDFVVVGVGLGVAAMNVSRHRKPRALCALVRWRQHTSHKVRASHAALRQLSDDC